MVFVTIHLTLLTPFPWRSFIFAVNSRKQFWGLEPDYGRWQYWNKQHSGKFGVYYFTRKYCHIFFATVFWPRKILICCLVEGELEIGKKESHNPLLKSGRESYILGLLPNNTTSIRKCCGTQQLLPVQRTCSLLQFLVWITVQNGLYSILNLFRLSSREKLIVFCFFLLLEFVNWKL